MKTFFGVLLLVGVARAAIGPAPEVERAIEARLEALFQEKDLLASDHAVLLASRYRRWKIEQRPEAELAALLAKCQAPPPHEGAYGDLTRVAAPPALADGGDPEALKIAVAWALAAARRDTRRTLPFGKHAVRRADLVASIELFADLLARSHDGADLARRVAAAFDVYRSPGLAPSGDVLYTAYHDPVFEGREKPDARFRWPAYALPSRAGIANERFSRAEIARGALRGHGLELVWLGDPLDAFLLEVEGSGLVRLPDGRHVKLEFAGKNGKPYRSLGKTMVRMGMMKPWEMSVPAIRQALAREPARLQEVLDTNPCQVFFRATMLPGAPAALDYVAERSVACDQGYFPRAGIGFALLERPEPGPDGGPARWVPHRRFIVNQDAGAAIRGPGHIDLYWGHDPSSGAVAGLMREPGALFYLLKKGTTLLAR